MLRRRKSEDYPNVFIPSHTIDDDADLSSNGGVCTFDDRKKNPQPAFPYLVRVGGGYRAFQTVRHARVYYRED